MYVLYFDLLLIRSVSFFKRLTKIPHKVRFLKNEAHKYLKNSGLAHASAFYLSNIKLLCFNFTILDEDKALIRQLAITLNLNMTTLELK